MATPAELQELESCWLCLAVECELIEVEKYSLLQTIIVHTGRHAVNGTLSRHVCISKYDYHYTYI